MKKLLLLLLLGFGFGAHAQVFIPFYGSVASQVSQANILSNLTQFQAFGVKYRGTIAQANTFQWLRQQYLNYGYSASQISEDVFSYGGSTSKNLVLTKTGTLYPNIFVIIDGHYDTVSGPGTNDNGSGTSIILEAARLLQNIPTQYSIKFINFSGEEDGLLGSQHFVNAVVNSTTPKMNIRLVINIDEVGGVAGMVNNTITCERDTGTPLSNNAASTSMTNQLANCIQLYSPLQTVIASAYSSDYIPFENNGEIITGLYETNESPYPHTPNDVLANMDPVYVYNVGKGTVGALLHFAVACQTCTLGVSENAVQKFVLYPNPASQSVNISGGDTQRFAVTITNFSGQKIFSAESDSSNLHVDVSHWSSGIYFAAINTADGFETLKFVVN